MCVLESPRRPTSLLLVAPYLPSVLDLMLFAPLWHVLHLHLNTSQMLFRASSLCHYRSLAVPCLVSPCSQLFWHNAAKQAAVFNEVAAIRFNDLKWWFCLISLIAVSLWRA